MAGGIPGRRKTLEQGSRRSSQQNRSVWLAGLQKQIPSAASSGAVNSEWAAWVQEFGGGGMKGGGRFAFLLQKILREQT